MIMKCLVVDDEHIARKLLSDYIEKVPFLELIGTCSTALEAMQFLKSNSVDVLFLDIEMSDLTGIDLLKIIPNKPATILTTAYSEYAVQGYELDVKDYLLKPIDFERFCKAIAKITSKPVPYLSHQIQVRQEEKIDRLFIKADNKIIKIAFPDIIMIKGQGPYVQIICENGRKIMSLQSMSKLAELLPKNFYRTHRSYIVNIDHIDSIDGTFISLKSNEAVLSRNKKDEFLQLIDQLNLLGE